MKIYSGKSVCGAAAFGKALVYRHSHAEVEKIKVTDTDAEKQRVLKAAGEAASQLQKIYDKAVNEIGHENAQIFESHIMLIEDEDYRATVAGIIETEKVCAEYAVSAFARQMAKVFSAMNDEYMRARVVDVKDVSTRIIHCLNPDYSEKELGDEKYIICADDLTPSETIALDKEKVLGFVTAFGSSYSHTSILAKSMNIPAVTGAGTEFYNEIRDGDIICVDGYTGNVIVDPDEKTIAETERKIAEEHERMRLLELLKGKENITADGKQINVFANIGGIKDLDFVLESDAGGIGLFRSEFLYLDNSDYPSENQQYEVYRSVLEKMNGRKVIIRTLDAGADKQADYFGIKKEENPALGLRAVRFCLTHPEVFRTQLRALYRASVHGRLGIMFPMITGVKELRTVLDICNSVKDELRSEGIPYSEKTETGIMIETPAAAVISDMLAPMVDFFSVGTNDLTQYTLACDRQNPDVEQFCDVHHEAVLRLVEMAAVNAHSSGKWIGICGELASDTSLTRRFLEMGIDELSVSPFNVLKLRDTVRSINLSEKT